MNGPDRDDVSAAQQMDLYIDKTLLGEIRVEEITDDADWVVGTFVPTDAFVPLWPLFEAATIDKAMADQIAALGFEIGSDAAERRRIVRAHIRGDTIRWKWAT